MPIKLDNVIELLLKNYAYADILSSLARISKLDPEVKDQQHAITQALYGAEMLVRDAFEEGHTEPEATCKVRH